MSDFCMSVLDLFFGRKRQERVFVRKSCLHQFSADLYQKPIKLLPLRLPVFSCDLKCSCTPHSSLPPLSLGHATGGRPKAEGSDGATRRVLGQTMVLGQRQFSVRCLLSIAGIMSSSVSRFTSNPGPNVSRLDINVDFNQIWAVLPYMRSRSTGVFRCPAHWNDEFWSD